MGDWLSFDTQAVKHHFIDNYYIRDRHDLLAPLFLNVRSVFIWEFFDYVGVLFELGFILLLLNKRYFSWFIIIAILFHIMNLLILNIKFTGNLPIYLLFMPYVLNSENKTKKKWASINWLWVFAVTCGLYFIAWFVFEIHLDLYDITFNLGFNSNITSLIIMLVILGCYLNAIIKQIRTKRKQEQIEF